MAEFVLCHRNLNCHLFADNCMNNIILCLNILDIQTINHGEFIHSFSIRLTKQRNKQKTGKNTHTSWDLDHIHALYSFGHRLHVHDKIWQRLSNDIDFNSIAYITAELCFSQVMFLYFSIMRFCFVMVVFCFVVIVIFNPLF